MLASGSALLVAQQTGQAGASAPTSFALDVVSTAMHPQYTTMKGTPAPSGHGVRGRISSSLPVFSHSIDYPPGNTFTYSMVGGDPFATGTGTTTVSTPVIGVRLDFPTGTTDATVPATDCGQSTSPVQAALGSPVFQDAVSGTQLVDAFERANFSAQTSSGGSSPAYHLLLDGATTTTVHLTVPPLLGQTGTLPCGSNPTALGAFVDASWLDSELTGMLSTLSGVAPDTFPIFLLYNTVICGDITVPQSCGILGYHAVDPTSMQTYGVVDYQLSNALEFDSAPLAHEVAEWADDPYVDNLVPTWGHVGQVSGCQPNLEVGDPLSNLPPQVITVGSTPYHIPDLAFTSWFYRETPSTAAGGAYSMFGTFTSPSDGTVCPAQPLDVKATAGSDGSLTAQWTEPTSPSSPVDGFMVCADDPTTTFPYICLGPTAIVESPTATSAAIPGVATGTTYVVRVMAVHFPDQVDVDLSTPSLPSSRVTTTTPSTTTTTTTSTTQPSTTTTTTAPAPIISASSQTTSGGTAASSLAFTGVGRGTVTLSVLAVGLIVAGIALLLVVELPRRLALRSVSTQIRVRQQADDAAPSPESGGRARRWAGQRLHWLMGR